MRRVSSRQRLVSWDAFDATVRSDSGNGNESSFVGSDDDVDEEFNNSGYETAQSQSFSYSSDLEGLSTDNANFPEKSESDRKETKHWMRRRKRDRKSLKSHCPVSMGIACKNIEIPKSSPSITSTTTRSPTVVPSYSWEIGISTRPIIPFDILIDDLHLAIFSFLDLSSLRSVASINRHYQELMTSDYARSSLWLKHCGKRWHIQRRENDQPPLKFVDSFHLPMAATSRTISTFGSELTNKIADDINLSLLLSLSPTNFPTSIDQDTVQPRTRLSRYIQQTIPAYRQEEEDHLIRCYQDSVTGRFTVRYTGYVGQGDRCIRSNHPLPRPSRPIYTHASDDCSKSRIASGAQFLGYRLSMLRCSAKSMGRGGSKPLKSPSSITTSFNSEPSSGWTPFVVPFVDQSLDDTITTVNVTPRFVSYFEVSILESEDNHNDDDIMSTTHGPLFHRTSNSDCVAVGVATEAFQYQSKMPGWDQLSYGYHGDDGGIFHSSGGMIKEFGPKYGPGDTVGCGIDYISKGIFYTLNGEFLGYAWKRLSDRILEDGLFPVVGIDTNSPIRLNLGSADSGAFQFDLSNFIKKDEKIISSIFSFDRLCCSDNMGAPAANCITVKKSGCSLSGLTPSRRQRKNLATKRNTRGG